MKELTIGNLIISAVLFFLSGYILGVGQNLTNTKSCGNVIERIINE